MDRLAREHPRSRGDNACRYQHGSLGTGTSPLARGQHLVAAAKENGNRNIPARAGTTTPTASKASAIPEHPRSRGDNSFRVWGKKQSWGTSPLARGQPNNGFTTLVLMRNIPVRAGTTDWETVGILSEGEHPRSRGDNRRITDQDVADAGTSPLARGQPCVLHEHNLTQGEHPRSRGDNT
ncbi:Domain of uncharacterised function (DUF2825) [Corynebacterium kutscheri]|nr:Domain of uncharacterised function (DUF2825) [Corynebacterium kutscheri]